MREWTMEEINRDASFLVWMARLEEIMEAWQAKHGNLPYELPLPREPENGNVCCWRDSYDDGMEPEEAFASDRTYWED